MEEVQLAVVLDEVGTGLAITHHNGARPLTGLEVVDGQEAVRHLGLVLTDEIVHLVIQHVGGVLPLRAVIEVRLGHVLPGDEILTLSTCEYSHENGRFVVVAKKVIEEAVDVEVTETPAEDVVESEVVDTVETEIVEQIIEE